MRHASDIAMWSERAVTRRSVLTGITSFAAFACQPLGAEPRPIPVAVASSLRFAMEQIGPAFARAPNGVPVRHVFGATGSLVKQIEEGAPFELFLAADEASVARLETAGRTHGPGRPLVKGRIALVVPKGAAIAPDGSLEGLRAAIAAGQVRRFAIANPELAPYGVAAREALTKAGLWEALSGRVALAENILQAAQFVASGGAEAGITSASVVNAVEVSRLLSSALIAEDRHGPIRQAMAVLKGAGAGARAYATFLSGPEAGAIFVRAGFALP